MVERPTVTCMCTWVDYKLMPIAFCLCVDTICNTKDAWLTDMLCKNITSACVNAVANDQVAGIGEDCVPR